LPWGWADSPSAKAKVVSKDAGTAAEKASILFIISSYKKLDCLFLIECQGNASKCNRKINGHFFQVDKYFQHVLCEETDLRVAPGPVDILQQGEPLHCLLVFLGLQEI
jgi:hypothetical protein